MDDFIFRGELKDLDPDLYNLTRYEGERQHRKLILIPSESTAAMATREALSCAFQNVYAEGYPPEETRTMTQEQILDYGMRLAEYRRFSDPRYYKGVEYVNTLEALTRRRCAEVFAANDVVPEEIFVNVQALSGAPANNAVYHALVNPGDTVMGMNLMHGGHLSHGSPVNRSGKFYNIVHYGVDPVTEKINYDAVEMLALEHKPKMIIAGFSSYSWIPDWKRFREIADKVGAYLFADIAHIAGMVAAGVVSSPIGIADVITFTTHKSLCGPRGAAILTTSSVLARKLDRAVFPGEQGGPHINTMAAQALAFKLAGTDQFRTLQKQAMINSKLMADKFAEAGLRVPFGGTDSHLINVDCNSIVGKDGTPLSGDMAARILDLAGVVVNRNTIPGDRSALHPSGIRLGTHWITERGFKEKETEELTQMMIDVLKACEPYSVAGEEHILARAKIDFDVLNSTKSHIRDLSLGMGQDFIPSIHGYPHFYYLDDELPEGAVAIAEIQGERAADMLRWATSARPYRLEIGKQASVSITANKKVITAVLKRTDMDAFQLYLPAEDARLALIWLRDLSDGFIAFDGSDPVRKIAGPVVITLDGMTTEMPATDRKMEGQDKPWFIGIGAASDDRLPDFSWQEDENAEVRQTALNETHREMGAKMVPFAGWDMPVWYTSVVEEHLATREAAGLFDVSHMGVYQVEGPQADLFLDSVVTNNVAALKVGQSHYTQLLDPDANVIDDAMVYRRADDKYLLVVNASNDDKDWAWLNAVKNGEVTVDRDRPAARAFGRGCVLRNLRLPEAGKDMLVDIAIQGPKSRDILLALGCKVRTATRLKRLQWAGVMEGVFGGIDLVVSRTGYTGERIAFELFVHPDKCVALWKALVKTGTPMGLQPIGLGARDSLRTEAGLPLYGHEMAGELGLGVGAAGFGPYVKTYKPWFIGRKAFLAQEAVRTGKLVRFRFVDKGVRMAHTGDPVVDSRGRVIGKVTSCAVDRDGYLLGQAVIEKKYGAKDTVIAIFQGASTKTGKAPSELEVGNRTVIPTAAKILSRFPSRRKKKK